MTGSHRLLVPGSTSNMGPGFDSLGLAVNLHLELTLHPDHPAGFGVQVSGEGSGILPADGRNRILKAAREIAGAAADRARWSIHSAIPVARGLGSSAAAVAAGCAAGYLLRDGRLPPRHEIFRAVARAENHPDNAAATVFGGFRVACREPSGTWETAPGVLHDARLRLLLVIPDIPVSTPQARSILPMNYTRAAAVRNLQNLALLLSGLARGDWHAVRRGCHDQLHEPYRLALVPGLVEALARLRKHPDAGGAYLSGAGPILVAFLPDPGAASALADTALEALRDAGTSARSVIIGAQAEGLRCEAQP